MAKDTIYVYVNLEENRCIVFGPVELSPSNSAIFINKVICKNEKIPFRGLGLFDNDFDIDNEASELMMHGNGFSLQDDGGNFFIVNTTSEIKGIILNESNGDPKDVMRWE